MRTNRRIHWTLITAAVFCCLAADSVSAQFGLPAAGGRQGTVSGTGVSSIEKKPDAMRMHIELMSKAGSLKEAIDGLKARKASARKTLEKLGAELETITYGDASISDGQSEQQRQLTQMMSMIEQQRGRTGRPSANKTSVPVTVTCSLTVDWKLKFESSEDLLLFVHPLQQELQTADLSGAKDASALSPEQKEMIEEMQGEYGEFGMDYYSSGEQEPGTPVFTYVATISEEEQDKALAEAFQKAKSDASRLSKATGAELGKLVSITSSSAPGSDDEYSSYYEQQYYLAQMLGASPTESASENEAVGLTPGSVKQRISVTAWFDFKE